MFTGLVECKGMLRSVSEDTDARGMLRISIGAPEIAGSIDLGESVAVSGVCLTVTSVSSSGFEAQMMPETARVTKLGRIVPGCEVNLERALRADGRFGGHIVQGHVDEVGRVLGAEPASGSAAIELTISSSDDIAWGIAPKGSICVDGVSLTVIRAGRGEFTVGVIPETQARTTLGSLRLGDEANIEIDVTARYIRRLIKFEEQKQDGGSGLTWQKLADYGWI